MNDFIALCAVGAEPVLTKELKKLNFKPYSRLPGRVFFTAPDDEDVLVASFRANYFLRTADRVFWVMSTAKTNNFDELFDLVYAIDWHIYFEKDVRVIVDKVRTYKSKLSSEHAIQTVVHKAICQKLCKKWNMHSLPESGFRFSIRVYMENNNCFICLDLSGDPLYRRGYRLSGGVAPMRETLAAVLLQLMLWKRKIPLHDAFCGSGTIPIEAAWYAYNIPPGIARHFAFENLSCFVPERVSKVLLDQKEKAAKSVRTDCLARITGSDINPEAVSLSTANAERSCIIAGRELQKFGLTHHIERPTFIQSNFLDLEAPYDEGLLLSNPPYGERIGTDDEALELYKKMPELLKNFPNWDLGFITSKIEFEKSFTKNVPKDINIEPLKRWKLMGGNMATFLFKINLTKI